MKHGIYYSTRPLPGGSHGILVSIWRNGRWLETNQNTQPWPTSAVALDRAKRTAMAARKKLNFAPKSTEPNKGNQRHD